MTTPRPAADEAWGRLVDAEEAVREPQMTARYAELARLSEEERQSRLRTMAEAEYTLPDDKLRPFIMSRMRVWLQMDLELVKKVASSYDAVMNQMSANAAMRRVAIVQTLAKRFTFEEQERLRTLTPRVFADRATGVGTTQVAVGTPATPTKSPRWAFWKKG